MGVGSQWAALDRWSVLPCDSLALPCPGHQRTLVLTPHGGAEDIQTLRSRVDEVAEREQPGKESRPGAELWELGHAL